MKFSREPLIGPTFVDIDELRKGDVLSVGVQNPEAFDDPAQWERERVVELYFRRDRRTHIETEISIRLTLEEAEALGKQLLNCREREGA